MTIFVDRPLFSVDKPKDLHLEIFNLALIVGILTVRVITVACNHENLSSARFYARVLFTIHQGEIMLFANTINI